MTKPVRGRPPHAPAVRRDQIIRARVTVEQRATFERIGGAAWLRIYLTEGNCLALPARSAGWRQQSGR
jgi:hypothetical protein